MKENIKKWLRRLAILFVAIGLFATVALLTGYFEEVTVRRKEAELQEKLAELPEKSDSFFSGKVTVAENDKFTLSLDCENGFLHLTDRANGKVYSSNPENWEADNRVEQSKKTALASQLEISFYNTLSQLSTYNSYTDALLLNQIVYEKLDNGVRVTYTLGKKDGRKVLPEVIRESELMKLTEKMSESARKEFMVRYKLLDKEKLGDDSAELIRKYPLLAEERLYELRSSAQERIKKILEKEYIAAGWTLTDVENEYAIIGLEVEEVANYFVVIPVEYTLDEQGMVARVCTDGIIESNSLRLATIKLLPYFGCADQQEEGYFLVPDGSGALIDMNSGKTSGYQQCFYGGDAAVNTLVKNTYGQTVVMPVFGAKYREGAMLAVVENGAANATLTASVAGIDSSYNYIYTSFQYRATDELSLSASLYNNTTVGVIAEKGASKDFVVRYMLLSETNADYTDMAQAYRVYLQDRGQLSDAVSQEDGLPFLVSVCGSVDKKDAILGFPVTKEEALTTFDEAAVILQCLKEDGVNNIRMQYYGWVNGGMQNTVLDSLTVQRNLGGNDGWQRLLETAEKEGAKLYPVLDFLSVYKESAFDNYRVKQDTARFISKTLVVEPEYSLVNGVRSAGAWTGYVISPGAQLRFAQKLLAKPQPLLGSALSLGRYGSTVNSNYNEKYFYDRTDAVDIQKQITASFSEEFLVMLSGGIADLLTPQVDVIQQMPISSSGFIAEDRSVPFYPMVLHGYITYMGEPLNLAQNYRENLLKTIETGAGLSVTWMAADNSSVFDTSLQNQYSMSAEIWYEQIISLYAELNDVLNETVGQTMTSHSYVMEKVTLTEYENGLQVFVNYTDDEQKVDDLVIPPQWFAVRKVET